MEKDNWDSLIERIEVHNSDKSSGHSHVKVDIYFTAVGMIDIPTEKEILATMEDETTRRTSNLWRNKRIRRSPSKEDAPHPT